MLRHALLILGLSLASGLSYADTGPFPLSNGYISLTGERSAITDLQFDPAGKGAYGANLIRRLEFPDVHPAADCRWERRGFEVVVSGLDAGRTSDLVISNGGVPEMLLAGHSLGQSFAITEGTLDSITAPLPTWNTKTSAATLRLRRDGPTGEIIASKRLENVVDNSSQSLDFAPQPAGTYYVELVNPSGQIGWWGADKDIYKGGQAFVDGQPVAGRHRALTVRHFTPLGKATFAISLAGPKLGLTLDIASPPADAGPAQLVMQTPWNNTGYDVSAKSVPFSRFFTDNQRYLPTEQFKRATDPGLSFGPCAWIHATGTRGYDLQFSADNLSLSWSMKPDTAGFQFGTNLRQADGGHKTEAFAFTVSPQGGTVPAEWPAFDTPDATLTRDVNRFFYERGFSYPAPVGPAAWLEWSALIRDWFAGPLHDGEVAGITGTVIDNEGYVYTWGGDRGWPFPDNRVYDTRHLDTNARFILACWRQACWTHDTAFLRGQAERVRRAMNYQLTTLQGDKGLIVTVSKDVTGRHKGVGDNYWDILPFGHLDAYVNVVYYASLEAMAQIETLLRTIPDLKPDPNARTPEFYRALTPKAREAYNQTFWDESKGRYIGCVDIDGKRHDYGFTFVNLEAMAYGLASPEQARRIYDWMEHGKSSTGKADIYSRWIFAPRSTTIHNPMWDEKGVKDPNADGVEPWWHFGWRGTPYGEVQCQDGGAILYTSFFDLMARSRLIGPDNAWGRWQAILGRYREPDRLCGGPPLFRGEIPQQANAGAVGLDIPFPESGLVPTWFLYGLAGVQATADGLIIAPRLPKALPWLVIRNLSYRGLICDLRVTNTSVELTSHRAGQEFTWKRAIQPGGQVILCDPPAPLMTFPS
jgi:hypothetical protein